MKRRHGERKGSDNDESMDGRTSAGKKKKKKKKNDCK